MKNLIAIALFGLCTFAAVNQASANEVQASKVQPSCYYVFEHWAPNHLTPTDIQDGKFVYRIHPNGVVEQFSHDRLKWTKTTTPREGWHLTVRGMTYMVLGNDIDNFGDFAYPSNDVREAKNAYLVETPVASDHLVVASESDPSRCNGLTPLAKRSFE
jgi:hypothetical protein